MFSKADRNASTAVMASDNLKRRNETPYSCHSPTIIDIPLVLIALCFELSQISQITTNKLNQTLLSLSVLNFRETMDQVNDDNDSQVEINGSEAVDGSGDDADDDGGDYLDLYDFDQMAQVWEGELAEADESNLVLDILMEMLELCQETRYGFHRETDRLVRQTMLQWGREHDDIRVACLAVLRLLAGVELVMDHIEVQ